MAAPNAGVPHKKPSVDPAATPSDCHRLAPPFDPPERGTKSRASSSKGHQPRMEAPGWPGGPPECLIKDAGMLRPNA
jgi:hypothetical protein